MKAKDLLVALQVDVNGSLNNLSVLAHVYAEIEEKKVNQLVLQAIDDHIEIRYEPEQPIMTVKGLVDALNQHKEATLYLVNGEKQLIYGYRLIEDGIVIG